MKEKSTVQTYFNSLLIIIFLCLIWATPFLFLDMSALNSTCILSFAINGLVVITGIFLSLKQHNVSIELIYWIFQLVFMYLAPVIQYSFTEFPWQGFPTDKEIIIANLLILLFNLVFYLGKWIAKHITLREYNLGLYSYMSSNIEYGRNSRIVFTVIACLLTVLTLYRAGLAGIIVARDQATNVFYSGDNTAIELIIESVVPAFFAFVVAESAQRMRKSKGSLIIFIILLICLLICFFPSAIPRYKTATIYGTILIVLFPKIGKGSRFFWAFTVALFILFPLFNTMRRVISMESISTAFSEGFFETYLSADYDAYRMFIASVRYVANNGPVLGYQLLGSLLFFVPRAVWPSKPIGSGAFLITNERGSRAFSNVSCPFIGEGYINFGFIGVVLYAALLGLFISKNDEAYWENKKEIEFSPYIFTLFLMFFVLRGDFLSGFAYAFGFMLTGLALKMISKYIS